MRNIVKKSWRGTLVATEICAAAVCVAKPAAERMDRSLRFQVYAALSFGAEAITWACWCKGWWANNVLDSAGRQTEQYGKLKPLVVGEMVARDPANGERAFFVTADDETIVEIFRHTRFHAHSIPYKRG